MRKVIVLFMLLTIMIQSTSQLWITLSFLANRDYIARVLCVNRNKPETACNGACQLKKQMKQDQENQEKSNIDSKVKELLVYFPTTAAQMPSANIFEWTEKNFSTAYCSFFLPEGFVPSIFHPPASIV